MAWGVFRAGSAARIQRATGREGVSRTQSEQEGWFFVLAPASLSEARFRRDGGPRSGGGIAIRVVRTRLHPKLDRAEASGPASGARRTRGTQSSKRRALGQRPRKGRSALSLALRAPAAALQGPRGSPGARQLAACACRALGPRARAEQTTSCPRSRRVWARFSRSVARAAADLTERSLGFGPPNSRLALTRRRRGGRAAAGCVL